MRALVTGATGHVGSHLMRHLLREGAEVCAVVRPASDPWRIADLLGEVDVARGDLDDPPSIARAVERFEPEVVFHLAWFGVTGGERQDTRQVTTNLIGSVRLFEAARLAGCACWIGLGSQAEYGFGDHVLHENVVARPSSLYGAAKLSVGALTRVMAGAEPGTSMRCAWLRLVASYGPMDDERRLIPSVIQALLAGRRPALTPGEQRWDYLYVEDVAHALYRAALSPRAEGVFVLASGVTHTVREIVELIRDRIDPALPLGLGETPYPPGQMMHREGDSSRLLSLTGWKPTTTLEAGLTQTVDWYSEHGLAGGSLGSAADRAASLPGALS